MMLTLFEQISSSIGLPAGLLAALCSIESNHRPNIVRPNDGGGTSSIGLCQIKISTAREVLPKISASELFKPETNMMAAGLYLKKKLKKYKNIPSALAAYNRGRVILDKSGKFVNKRYVDGVLKEWKIQKRKISILKVS
jgi:soluble lytic murein transglycosylase-like protein